MDKLQLRETILKQIERPDIPDREFPACLFGVVPDSGAVQTQALQHNPHRGVGAEKQGGASPSGQGIRAGLCQ